MLLLLFFLLMVVYLRPFCFSLGSHLKTINLVEIHYPILCAENTIPAMLPLLLVLQIVIGVNLHSVLTHCQHTLEE